MDPQMMSRHVQDLADKLRRADPEMDFLLLVIPFHKTQIRHLGTEGRVELERRVIDAGQVAFQKYLVDSRTAEARAQGKVL